jgi:hypothetical protein
MKVLLMGAALLWAAASPLLSAKPEPTAAYPVNVTLQAKAGGRYLLTWDPIREETLMGYSVWMRKKGEKEFTRLSVPVRVGKEIQKQPMTAEAKLELKLGEGRKDLEFSVLAEYEDGPSERSDSVYSAKAAGFVPPVAAGAGPSAPLPAPAGGSGQAPSVSSAAEAVTAKADPYADENKPQPPVAEKDAPWNRSTPRQTRPLLPEAGRWLTTLGIEVDLMHSTAKGRDLFSIHGLGGTGIDPNKFVTWKRSDSRTRVRVPLRAERGLFTGLSAGLEGSYQAEDVYISQYLIDGQSFDYITYVRYLPDGSYQTLPNATSSTFGDTKAFARLQPVPSQPLVLTAQATFPTGRSRFAAYRDWLAFRDFAAGTGEGVQRLQGRVDWGWRGLRQGLSLHAAYSPSATENFTESFHNDFYNFDYSFKHVVVRGARTEAGMGYTIPWNLRTLDGAIVLGAAMLSTDGDRWTINGTDMAPFYAAGPDQAELDAHAGIKFQRDDQLELSVDALQSLPGGFETGGRFSYSSSLTRERYSLSGRLVY